MYVCVCCDAGAASSLEALCLPCPPGTFASNDGSSMCLACPLGYFSVSMAAQNCSSCWSETTESCNSIRPRGCIGRFNSLKFRVNPAKKPGNYLCQFGRSANTPEFVCNIPYPSIQQKLSCDFEASLLCKFQLRHDGTLEDVQLKCQSSM
jgi:hypothetical protein